MDVVHNLNIWTNTLREIEKKGDRSEIVYRLPTPSNTDLFVDARIVTNLQVVERRGEERRGRMTKIMCLGYE
jgi:hypothetical protein